VPRPARNPLVDPGDFTVGLTRANCDRFPGLAERIATFDAGDRPSARAAVDWLQMIDVDGPQESVTTLFFLDGALVGFFALANAQVELTSGRRKKLDLHRATQPAVLVTWIAKSSRHAFDGTELVKEATYQALKAAEYSAATLLALDPFDEATAEMWRRNYGFFDTKLPRPGGDLKRLAIVLQAFRI
jgi:hypothetical protein